MNSSFIKNNILLTGIPRSGTTLVCSLLNRLENTVALVEPMNVSVLPRMPDAASRCHAIGEFLANQRQSLLEKGTATARTTEGVLDDNTFSNERNEAGLRQNTVKRLELSFEKELDADFLLSIKHPNAFTAILPELAGTFRCFAMIRHPASVLASWETLDLPLREGHAPAAENLDSELKHALAVTGNLIERQIHLLDWYYAQYRRSLPPGNIIRYEDVIESGGKELERITPKARYLDETLENRNKNRMYSNTSMREISQRLSERNGSWRRFYDT